MLGIPTFSFCHTILSECNLQKTIEILKIIQNISFSQHHFDSHEIHHLPVRFTPSHFFFGQRHHCRVEAHPLSSFPCHSQPLRWWHQKYQVPCSQAEMLQSHPCCTLGETRFVVNRRNEILETEVQLYITICNNTCVYHIFMFMYFYLLIC